MDQLPLLLAAAVGAAAALAELQHTLDAPQVRQADGVALEELPLETFRSYSELIEGDVYDALSLERCVKARNSEGGTSPKSVAAQLSYLRAQLG